MKITLAEIEEFMKEISPFKVPKINKRELKEYLAAFPQSNDGKADSKKQSQNTGDTLNRQMESATSLDELRTIADQMHTMHAAGQITQDQMDTFQGKADAAAERIQEDESGTISDAERAASAAGNDVAQNKSEVAGTFSAAAVSGMGFGGGLAERTAVAAEKTATHTGKLAEQGAAEVGE